jgi:predicted XRE-type DNA-binding protein
MNAITHGSNNVFDDLGYVDAAERQTKTRLALAVNELLKRRKLKQRETALLLGIAQPKVSALKNYRLDQFSVEKLMEFLTALNQDIEIMIRPRVNTHEAGHISVLAVQ